MKRGVSIVVIIVILGFIFGCDQIQKFFAQRKKEVKPVVASTAKKETEKVQTVTQEEPKGTKLAKVNDKVITYEEFEQNIKNLQALSEEIKVQTFDEKKTLLDDIINQELLYQEAKSRGVPNRQEVKDLAEGYLRGLAVRQLLLDITENVTVDAQEIETFYNQYKDQISEPEQRRVREIVVSSEDRAREILISLLQGADFATIAKEKSISESSKDAGDIGFITRGQRGEEYKKFDEIAFSSEAGVPSSIFKGPQGYYILKVEEVKATKAKLLTDPGVWDQIKDSLLGLKQQQRAQDLIDKLRRDAKIEIVEDLLK